MIGAAAEAALQDAAHAVDWVRSGQTALDVATHQHYDLLLLDLGLPGRGGRAVLGSLRARDNPVPMLIPTAHDAMDEYVRSLGSGADDYILKPLGMVELLARICAIPRRKDGAVSPMLTDGVLAFNPAAHEVRTGSVESVRLSACEFALLQALMLWPGAILSRVRLEECIYGWGREVASNTVEFLTRALRKGLGAQAIKNVRGVGWMIPRGQ